MELRSLMRLSNFVTGLFDLKRGSSRVYLGVGLLGLAALAAFVVIAGMPAMREMALLLAAPLFFVALALKESPKLMLALLAVSLSFSARYRLFGIGFHQGGAELAIAPLDFPLLGLILLAVPKALSPGFWRTTRAAFRPLFWPLALFLSLHLLSIPLAADRGLALLELLRMLKMVLLMLVLKAYISSRRDLRFVITLLLITVIMQGGLACLQWVSGEALGLGFLGEHGFWDLADRSGSVGRAGGTLGHANSLACFLDLLTPLALSLALASSSRGQRILAAVAVVAGVAGVFVTLSRAAWLALPLGLATVLVLHIRGKRVDLRKLGLIFLGSMVLVAVVVAVNADLIALRFSRVWSTSGQFRLSTAKTALNMIRSKPFFGIGANNYEAVSDAYLTADDGSFNPENARIVVHNVFLLHAAELGLTGLAAFLIVLFALLKLAWQLASSRSKDIGATCLGILGGIVALLMQNQLGWGFRYDPIFTLFWFLAGLVLAMDRIRARDEALVTSTDLDATPVG